MERVNTLVEQYLRGYCNYQQDNWTELLTMAEFSYNNTLASSMGITPFYAMYGEHPKYLIHSHPEFTLPPPTIRKNSPKILLPSTNISKMK